MKQRITLDQILSLKPEGLDKLEEWVEPRGYTLLLTLGQMIDFLSDTPINIQKRSEWHGGGWQLLFHTKVPATLTLDALTPKEIERPELRDALWEACKEVLERKEAAV